MAQNYSKELIEKVKKYYVENTISFGILSENSKELFGTHIDLDTLRWWSKDDVEGSWSILRANQGRQTSEVPSNEKLNTVADKLYEMLVDEDDKLPKSAIASVAKTWLDIVVRAKLNTDVSAKTSPQEVKDMFDRFEAEAEKLE